MNTMYFCPRVILSLISLSQTWRKQIVFSRQLDDVSKGLSNPAEADAGLCWAIAGMRAAWQLKGLVVVCLLT